MVSFVIVYTKKKSISLKSYELNIKPLVSVFKITFCYGVVMKMRPIILSSIWQFQIFPYI